MWGDASINRRCRLAFVSTFILVGALFLIGQPAQAITLIPPSIEFIDVSPGEAVTTKVKLFNETAAAVTLYPSRANFTALDETGTPNIQPESEEDLAGWLALDPGPFTIQPGERLEIPVEVKVPADAAPGGHFATILFSPQPPSAVQGGQLAIGQKIGTLVLVRVKGIINESGSIVEFGIDSAQRMFTRLPIDFLLRFKNSGNVHLRPNGTVTIRNLIGGTSATVPVNSGLGAVLPLSTRKFETSWARQPGSTTTGGFFQEIGREWENFALGPYTASVDLNFGSSNDKSDQATVRFWVVPWRLLLVGAIVLVLLILLIIFLIRRYNRWVISRAQKPPQAPNQAKPGDETPTRSKPGGKKLG